MTYYNISLLGSPLEPFTYHFSKALNIGTKVDINVRNRVTQGIVISTCDEPAFSTNEILEISDFFYDSKQMALAKFISTYYLCSLGESLALMMPFSSGCVALASPLSLTVSSGEAKATHPIDIKLSAKQEKALEFLQEHKVSLLFGDTGSGKTEIYMKYFEAILSQGERAIFLMPEISLTPQKALRLDEHFGSSVVMWHSKLLQNKKK